MDFPKIPGFISTRKGKITTESEAKVAAEQMFRNVAREGAEYITLDDLRRFMCEEEAMETMRIFGVAPDKKVSKLRFKSWVVNDFKGRRVLAFSMKDNKKVFTKLDRIQNFLFVTLILNVFLLIFGVATTTLLMVLGAQIGVHACFYGKFFKTVFNSMIIVYVKPPFAVGDWCEVDAVEMHVQAISLLNTMFLTFENVSVKYSNVVLADKPIRNFSHSFHKRVSVEFYTTIEKLETIKQQIISYVEKEEEYWLPAPKFVVMDIDEVRRLKIAVWVTPRMNHAVEGEMQQMRSLLILELNKVLREIDTPSVAT